MVNLNGKEVNSVSEILDEFREHPHSYPGTYRVRYTFGPQSDAYHGARLERPAAFRMNAGGAYPWETIIVAAANCAGSDYPMLAEHYDVDLAGVEIELEADFDPRGEFAGLRESLPATPEMRHCYRAFRWKATLHSSASPEKLRTIHERVLSHNMVLDALRAVPITSELVVKAPAKELRA